MFRLFVDRNAAKIALVYIAIAILWILFSDYLVSVIAVSARMSVVMSVMKGWLFVFFTGWILYILIRNAQTKMSEQNEELIALNEELIASDEEIRQQFEELVRKGEEINRQNAILTSLHQTSLTLMQRLDLDELLTEIITNATQLIGSAHGHIALLNKAEGVFERKMGFGHFQHDIGRKMKLDEGLSGEICRTGKLVVIDDYATWDKRIPDPFFDVVNCIVEVPLYSRSQIVGRFGVAFLHSERKFTETELILLNQFAELSAIALENATLYTTAHNELVERRKVEAALQTAEASYRAIFDAASDAIFVHETGTGNIIDVNQKANELLGLTTSEIMKRGLAGIGSGKSPCGEEEARRWMQLAAVGQAQLIEWEVQNQSGELIAVEVNLKRSLIGDQDLILAVVRDISERKNNEEKMRKIQVKNQALINAIPDLMFIQKPDGTIVDFHANNQDKLYIPVEQFLGKKISDIMPKDISMKAMEHIEEALQSKKIQVFEYQLPCGDTVDYFETRIIANGDEEVISIIRNISDKKKVEKRLEYLSLHDTLTDLYNRAYFEEEMKRIAADREGVAGIIVCDLDGLKFINDTLGHSMGDEVLRGVAEVLKAAFRPTDLVARIGGDEFAILLPSNEVSLFEAACARIEQMIEAYNLRQPTVPLNLSLGFAVSRGGQVDSNALFKEADNNMYREKLHRKNSTKSSLVNAMMSALEARDFITEGHGDRLQRLVVGLAAAMGLPEYQNADLRLLARFHDIGKVGISDQILFKPGRLSEEEYKIMQGHCEIGYRIADSAGDLAPIANWILKHHEWWNGQGYPLCIKGSDIPIECRMLSLADAYDAMTNDRPYRQAMSHEEACAELRRGSGVQFDPDLVEPFIGIAAQLQERNMYQ